MDEKKIDELSNEICMGAIDYTTERNMKPHRNGVHGHIAERLAKKGYCKQSDTAREICLKIIKDQPKSIKEKWVEWFNKEYGVDLGE